MHITCTQENIARALSYLERVAGKQSTLPILSNFLLETEKGRLKISATNLEIGIVAVIGAKIESEGRIAVPAKILNNFINNLPSGDVIELSVKDQHLLVVSTAYQIRIKGMDAKDYPIIPQYKKEYQYSFPAQKLKNALSRLLFCVSLNEARLELTGVCLSISEDNLRLAATDSFRLAEEVIAFHEKPDFSEAFDQEHPLIIPNGVLHEVLRVITPESEVIRMALEENQVFFEVDGVEITSRVINGKYPDYQQIIPKEFSLEVVFERSLLLRAIKIAGSLSSYTSGEIALVFDPEQKTCTFLSRSQEVGENQTVVPVEYQKGSSALTLLFNPRYVLEGINAFSSEKVLFSANTATTPAALRMVLENGGIDREYLYLMMPIRK